jgi:hypothetical protein
MPSSTEDDFNFEDDFDEFNLEDRAAGSEPNKPGEEVGVEIEHTQWNGEECAELYAHGEAFNDEMEKVKRKVLLARVTETELTMFPLVSAYHRHEFLQPKYGSIEAFRISAAATKKGWRVPPTVEKFNTMIGQLPVGFSRFASRGLGFRWEYRLIAEAIAEATDATTITFEAGDGASVADDEFSLGMERFERVRKAIDTITERARKRSMTDRENFTFNELLHIADAGAYPKRQRRPKAGEIYELVQISSRDVNRSGRDRTAAADLVRRDAAKTAKENPAALLELKSEIERVTLGELIDRFQALIDRDPKEDIWQAFFEANPFVLSIAFPHPVTLVRGQAHVGGTKLDGRGESIADFLFTQRLTGGIAIFEIKTTKTPLLEPKPFRGDLYAPNKLLCATISQVLDQRSELTTNFHAKKVGLPGMQDTHVGHVHCVVIAGRSPDTLARRRSLDLFRNATKDVAVVTFDELLEKLRAIHALMSKSSTPPASLAKIGESPIEADVEPDDDEEL